MLIFSLWKWDSYFFGRRMERINPVLDMIFDSVKNARQNLNYRFPAPGSEILRSCKGCANPLVANGLTPGY